MRPRDLFRELAVACALVVVAAVAVATGVLAPLQRVTADALVRLAAGRPPEPPRGLPDVAIVALDPQSLRAFPAWPWPRRIYAEAVARLDAAGAKVIAFDIDFSAPRDPADDAAFRDAIERSDRVVLAAFRQRSSLPGGGEIEVASLPQEAFAAAAAGTGSVLVPIEPDGIVRHAPRASAIGGAAMPSLAAAALAVAVGERPQATAESRFRLDYRRVAPPFPMLSIADVVDGRFDPREVAGRVVLIGATAAEFQDLWPTPLGPARPGVLLQAVAYRTLAAERVGDGLLATPGPAVELACLAGLAIIGAAASAGSHRRRVFALCGLGLASAGGIATAAVVWGTVVDPVLPLGLLASHYALGLEGLQRRFGRRLAERELNLSTLFRVGEATAQPTSGGGLELALALLGDVVDASAVALLRAQESDAGARLDPRRIEWRRGGAGQTGASAGPGGPIGDAGTALRVLADRRLRVFEGTLPGRGGRGGLAVYVPLHAADVPVGVLVVERNDPAPLDEVQLRTIATVGAQLALSAENVRLIEGLRATLDASVAAIATAIEARDGYTEAHCRRLAAFSGVMAFRLGLPAIEVEAVRLGALLHDVGKIGIRDQVLLKPGRFTPEERRDMERHPEIGHRIIGAITGLRQATFDCVRHHHEYWNGTGYPAGLEGEAIPLGARIVAIVDVWDALSTARPYKGALPADEVRAHLEKLKGIQFDPELVDLFLRILDEESEEMRSLLADPAQGEA